MLVFRARLVLVITYMNAASLKYKKDATLKRDSKAVKKAAAESGKPAVQQEKSSAASASDKGGRRKSLVTFDDSKAEKQFFDKAFSMWNLLDKFSRSKVCERALNKMYRSNRVAVVDYYTTLLPKWEAWKAAEDIRDSVKFQIGDTSRRKRWTDSCTMAAPEYPRLRCQAKSLQPDISCVTKCFFRCLQPFQGLPRLIGTTILEVLPETMFSSAPPQPTSGKGSKASPRKKL